MNNCAFVIHCTIQRCTPFLYCFILKPQRSIICVLYCICRKNSITIEKSFPFMYIGSSEKIIRDVAYICVLFLQKSCWNALYLFWAQKSSILCEGLQKCLRERVLALGCSRTNVFHSFQSFYENGYNFLKMNKSIWFEMIWTMQ